MCSKIFLTLKSKKHIEHFILFGEVISNKGLQYHKRLHKLL